MPKKRICHVNANKTPMENLKDVFPQTLKFGGTRVIGSSQETPFLQNIVREFTLHSLDVP